MREEKKGERRGGGRGGRHPSDGADAALGITSEKGEKAGENV